MDINLFDDKNNGLPLVRIVADSPSMRMLIEAALAHAFRLGDKGEALTVVCTDGTPCEIEGSCVYIGSSPENLKKGQVKLSRPVDIDVLVGTCVSLIERGVSERDGWSADSRRRVAVYGSSEAVLTKREFELFLILLERMGECVSRSEIEARLWNGEAGGNCADVYVCYLRKKLEKIAGPGVLISVRGRGYMLKTP